MHVNLHKMEFSMKQISWKSQKSTKFTALKKERPTVLEYQLVINVTIAKC